MPIKKAKKVNIKNVFWGATLPNGKKISGGNLDIIIDICPKCTGLGISKRKKTCKTCEGTGRIYFKKIGKLS